MHTTSRRVVLLACLASVACGLARGEDEVEGMVRTLLCPRRFASHEPSFSVRETIVEQITEKGTRQLKLHLVMDGDRHVAVFNPEIYQLDVVTFSPARAPRDLIVPPLYTWARLFGERITTCMWYGHMGSSNADDHRYAFSAGGSTLTLTVDEVWTEKFACESRHTFTLSLDARLGYVWNIRTHLSTDTNKHPTDKKKSKDVFAPEFLNAQPADVSSPWPDAWRHDRTVYSHKGGTGWRGFWNNLPAMDRSDQKRLQVRNGGFVGWMEDERGWGVALVHSDFGDLEAFNVTCNYWGDQHHLIRLPSEPDADGRYVVDAGWRYVGLPPEIVRAVAAETSMMDFGGAREVQVRCGVPEDFEEQPLPLTTKTRGSWCWGVSVSEERARNGRKSLVVKGTPRDKLQWPTGRFIAPFIPLQPDATYLCEAYVYVEDENAIAYISNGFPRDEKWRIGKRQTTRAHGGRDEWQRVHMTVKTGRGGGQFDLRFICAGGGRAFFDDFRLVKIDE